MYQNTPCHCGYVEQFLLLFLTSCVDIVDIINCAISLCNHFGCGATLADNAALRSGALNGICCASGRGRRYLVSCHICWGQVAAADVAVSGAWVAALHVASCNAFGIFGSTNRCGPLGRCNWTQLSLLLCPSHG